MKTHIQTLRNKLLRNLPAVGLVSLLVGVMLPLAAFAWGPSRPTFTIEKPASYVTFNSITNNPAHGDERNFMQVKESGANSSTYADEIALRAGKEYTVYMYYHNNAATNYNASGEGIARNAYARAEIPAVVEQGSSSTKAVGYVGADNANPRQVWDDISFSNSTGGDIALRYVAGSATIHSRGAVDGAKMSDSIISSGASLGYDSLNGVLPGCNEYAGYITFNVKADQPNFTLTKQVRKDGESGWNKTTALNPGETAEYLISYKNTGSTQQNDVTIQDALPEGMTYVAGSTKLTNGSSPDGREVADGVAAGGIQIGDYAPGAAAYVTFKATVAEATELNCGAVTLTNTGRVETSNGNKSDTADVTVQVDCKPDECKPGIPKGDERCEDECVPGENETKDENGNCVPAALPTTGPAEVIAGVLGVTLLALGIAYWVRSHKSYKRALAGFTGEMTDLPDEKLLEARTETRPEDDKHTWF